MAGAALILVGFIADARGKFLPNTTIDDLEIGSLRFEEALSKLETANLQPPSHAVEIVALTEPLASSSAQLSAHYEYESTLKTILENQKKSTLKWLGAWLFNRSGKTEYSLPISYDQNQLKTLVEELKRQFDKPAHQPSAKLGVTGQLGSLIIDQGEDIFTLETEATLAKTNETLNQLTTTAINQDEDKKISISGVTTQLSQKLSDEQIEAARLRAAKIVGERLMLERDYQRQTLSDVELVSFLTLPDGYNSGAIETLTTEWAEELKAPPQNAEFEYDRETLAVAKFVPHRNGRDLDLSAAKQLIIDGLTKLENTETAELENNTLRLDLPLIETPPELALEETNDLGIKERIGFGESYYYHSIPSRIHNVALTTNRVNLTLVAPGEEFSFNEALGDVSAATGFQPAYVIKDGQTMLGDGGGVCQVSSTLFRALLNSGLDITRRLQHSYRVSYYELDSQPGFDATVYSGNVDLRFINDTDHYVLIYSQADSNNLYMTVELYGTSDGRTAEITDYQSWDPRPPLPTQYIPDPSLAPGQLKQIDWSASGIRAKFMHTVRDKDGNIIHQNEYVSNYRPWAAKFLQGV